MPIQRLGQCGVEPLETNDSIAQNVPMWHYSVSTEASACGQAPWSCQDNVISSVIAFQPESVKRMKPEAQLSTPVPTNPTLPKPRPPARVTVEDAGPSARNGAEDDELEPSEEDEDGRFFGDGLTSQQRDILNIFDGAGGEGAVSSPSSPLFPDIVYVHKPSAHPKARALPGLRDPPDAAQA